MKIDLLEVYLVQTQPSDGARRGGYQDVWDSGDPPMRSGANAAVCRNDEPTLQGKRRLPTG